MVFGICDPRPNRLAQNLPHLRKFSIVAQKIRSNFSECNLAR